MTIYRDNLGHFYIPPHLLELSEKYVPEQSTYEQVFAPDPGPAVWTVVKSFKASKGTATHTVERKGNELKCSCQSFRIQKTGSCKHTVAVADELGI